MYGKKSLGIIRSTVLIDPAGEGRVPLAEGEGGRPRGRGAGQARRAARVVLAPPVLMERAMSRPFDPVVAPPLAEQVGATFPRLVELMQRLLAPDGCPWDREQTFASLRRYTLEEACEVVDAIDSGDRGEMRAELGDLLLQIVFQAELGRNEGSFGPDDVVAAICDKLVRRHPHVFADGSASDAKEVLQNWERIKATERAGKPEKNRGVLGGVPRSLPR